PNFLAVARWRLWTNCFFCARNAGIPCGAQVSLVDRLEAPRAGVVHYGYALHPQTDGMPMDACDHLRRYQREAQECMPNLGGIPCAPFQLQGGVKQRGSIAVIVGLNNRRFGGIGKGPAVLAIHLHEWRNVESLVEDEVMRARF